MNELMANHEIATDKDKCWQDFEDFHSIISNIKIFFKLQAFFLITTL